MNPFESLAPQSDPIAENATTMLRTFTDQYQTGQLTEAEFQELSLDVLDMTHIDNLALDLTRKNEVAKAYEQLLAILKTVSKFI